MNNKKTISKDIISTKDIKKYNFSKPTFYKIIKENKYEKVAPGIFISENTIIDNLLLISKRCTAAVISHDEALYYYGLIDREPIKPTFTIYSGYNAAKLTKSGYKAFYVKKELLNLGKTEIIDYFGNKVPMYDLERTICDLIRNRNYFEIQDFTSSIKNYVRRNDKDINKLFEYAEKFKITKILRQYLEVLL